MTKRHRDYEFGTFNERLEHLCALFETDPPEMAYEDGEPLLTDTLAAWIKEHEVNMDWLFVGSPCAMLRQWAKARSQERQIIEINRQLEPEIQAGMLAYLRAVVIHGIPVEEAEPLMAQVVQEYRGRTTASPADAPEGMA